MVLIIANIYRGFGSLGGIGGLGVAHPPPVAPFLVTGLFRNPQNGELVSTKKYKENPNLYLVEPYKKNKKLEQVPA